MRGAHAGQRSARCSTSPSPSRTPARPTRCSTSPTAPASSTSTTEIALQYHDAHLPDGAFDVTFEDVGGLNKQIKLIRELVQLPLSHPQVYRHLGINPPRGIILYGPPGSGKSHLARAVANEVDARFYYINGPDVIGTYTGETEANLRRMFNEAGHHAPSIIFIDELDAMAPKRGETGAHADTRTVTQLLALMDGLKRVDSVIVIGTTNRIDAVDPAFRRPGRFDREIFIGPPDVAGRREILEIHTREMPLSDDAQAYLDEIAKRTHGFLGADLMELCRDAGLSRLRRSAGNLSDHRAAFRIPLEDLRVEREDFELALSQIRPSALRETLISVPDVSWNDIGGLDAVKRRLQETVELPLRNPQLLTASGLPPHVGVLLYGPPGTGKTLLAKALANECGVNFISVDGPEIFTKWLGEIRGRRAADFPDRAPGGADRDLLRPARSDRADPRRACRLDDHRPRGEPAAGRARRRRAALARDRARRHQPHRPDRSVDPAARAASACTSRSACRMPPSASRSCEVCLRGTRRCRQRSRRSSTAVVPLTDGYSGATLRQLCDDAKRAAIKRTNFTKVAAPTVADMREAIDAQRAEKQRKTRMAEIERTRERERPPLADNPYEKVMRQRAAMLERNKTGPIVVRKADRPMQQARQGKLRYYLEPLTHPETPLQMWRVFTHEIRTKSGKHRHQGGLVIYVLEGKGYSIVEGQRIDWEKGDLVLLPLHPNEVEHQHFNLDPEKPSVWCAFIHLPIQEYLASDLQQMENSPDFKG